MLNFKNLKDIVYTKEGEDSTINIVCIKDSLTLSSYNKVCLNTGLFVSKMEDWEEFYVQAAGDELKERCVIRSEVDDNTSEIVVYVYNLTNEEVTIQKDSELCYIFLASNALSQIQIYGKTADKIKDLNAYTVYADDEIIVKQTKPNIIGNTKYTICPDGTRSFTIFFNKG